MTTARRRATGPSPAGGSTGRRRAVGAQSDDAAAEGPPGDPDEVARIVCLRLLDRRAYSRAELATALAKRGVPAEAADRVLDRFTAVGLIDDVALADSAAAALHRERRLAGRAVAQKLRQRGIADDVVAAAVSGIDHDSEQAAAEALVQRKLRSVAGLPPDKQARRLVGLLARKGYAPGLAHDVVRRQLAGLDECGEPWPDPGIDHADGLTD